jgi:hypothetical protein
MKASAFAPFRKSRTRASTTTHGESHQPTKIDDNSDRFHALPPLARAIGEQRAPWIAVSNGLFPGLAGVVKMLADEWGPSGVRVNGILPVRIATDRVRQLDAQSGDPDEVRARKSQEIPLRGYGEPAEFGRVAAFLLSPAASYMTGAMVPVDGGSIRAI